LSTGATTGALIATGALTGSAVASGVVALGEQASTTPDWQAVPMAALAGMGFGAVGGALGRSAADANAGIRSSLDEVHEAVADGTPAARIDPDLPAWSDNIWSAPLPKVDQPAGGSSVGAAQAPGAQLVDDTAE